MFFLNNGSFPVRDCDGEITSVLDDMHVNLYVTSDIGLDLHVTLD